MTDSAPPTPAIPCNLCGSTRSRIRFPATSVDGERPVDVGVFRCTSFDYGEHPEIRRCLECDLTYAVAGWQDSELLDKYVEVEDALYLSERAGRVKTFRRHLRALQRRSGPPAGRKLLDVGAYIGVFVEVARAAGWDAVGVEPSRWAVSIAERDGLPVSQGTLSSIDPKRASFDVVTIWDVVEHFSDPRAELCRAFELLQPGGLIVVHTIDAGSLTAKLMGARWPFLMEMHVFYFSRRTLRRMLEEIGFDFHSVHTAGRYLSLGYLAGRIGAAFGAQAGAAATSVVRALRLDGVQVSVNTLDLFTMYARKPVSNKIKTMNNE